MMRRALRAERRQIPFAQRRGAPITECADDAVGPMSRLLFQHIAAVNSVENVFGKAAQRRNRLLPLLSGDFLNTRDGGQCVVAPPPYELPDVVVVVILQRRNPQQPAAGGLPRFVRLNQSALTGLHKQRYLVITFE